MIDEDEEVHRGKGATVKIV